MCTGLCNVLAPEIWRAPHEHAHGSLVCGNDETALQNHLAGGQSRSSMLVSCLARCRSERNSSVHMALSKFMVQEPSNHPIVWFTTSASSHNREFTQHGSFQDLATLAFQSEKWNCTCSVGCDCSSYFGLLHRTWKTKTPVQLQLGDMDFCQPFTEFSCIERGGQQGGLVCVHSLVHFVIVSVCTVPLPNLQFCIAGDRGRGPNRLSILHGRGVVVGVESYHLYREECLH